MAKPGKGRQEDKPARRRPYGTGHVYQRGQVWWIAYHANGALVRESAMDTETGLSTRTDAERLLRRRVAERDAGRGRPSRLITLGDLQQLVVDNYLANGRRSVRHMKAAWARVFRTWPATEPATAILPARIERYISLRRQAGAASSTINRELAQVRRGFRLAVRLGLLATRPDFHLLQEPPARSGFFEAEHLEAVLRHLPEHVRPVIQVAYETGWRVASEILTREWRHVDMDAGWLRLEPGEGKTGRGRQFPFTARLRAVLEAQKARTDALQRELGRRIATVFPRPDGDPVLKEQLRHAWEKARVAAGRPGALLHDFRRTAVRNLERAGISRSAAMRMVGHETEAIYRRYAIVDEVTLKDAAAKLDAGAGGAVNNTVNNGKN